MVNFKKVMMAAPSGGDSYWLSTFYRSGENIFMGNAKEYSDGQVVVGGNYQSRNFVVSLNASTGSDNFSFSAGARSGFYSAESSDLGYAPPQSALYDPVQDVYAIGGFSPGGVTGSNVSGQSVAMVIYDRNVSTTASQLNRTWGKDYQDGGATADGFNFNSVGDLITSGLGRYGGGDVSFSILYDQSDTGYGAAYTPTRSCYLANSNTAYACRHAFTYLNSSEELIMVGNHMRSNGYLDFGVAKISGATWNTLDYNKAYQLGNGNDKVEAVSYNPTLDHVAILHRYDSGSGYTAVTLVDCSDGSVTNSFNITNIGNTGAFILGRVIALDSQYNVYIGCQSLSSSTFGANEHPFLKIKNADTTSRSLEWMIGFNGVSNDTVLEYCHINSLDTPIVTYNTKSASSGTKDAGYVLKMNPDGSIAGNTYLNTQFIDRTSSGVSISTLSPTTVTGNITLNNNYPDNLSFQNTSGATETSSWISGQSETSL